MKKQLQKLSIWQTSKVIALVYLLGSAIIFVPAAIIAVSMGTKEAIWWLLFPLIYWLGTIIGMVIFCCLYNVAAKWVGGIEFQSIDIFPPKSTNVVERSTREPEE